MTNQTVIENLTQELEVLKRNVDDVFLLTNGIIVSLMQAGFACLEAGSVRTKNATNIMMKNIMDLFICAICYYLVGYSLGYGRGSPYIGLTYWAGVGLKDDQFSHWFFQFVFAATASTIISGAVAERCNFYAYILYSAVISGVTYPIVSHWVWYEDGWLLTLGFKDFAGSGAVHALAGVCSFVGAGLLGPRYGRFDNGKPQDLPGHSTPLVGLGGLLLITGFLAFNGGSLGHASNAGDGSIISKSMVHTILAGTGSGLTCMVLSSFGIMGKTRWPFTITLNGVLTGMVAVCAGADVYNFFGSVVIGALAFPVYIIFRHLVLLAKVDDPLDAVAVHFCGGMWGVIAVAIFSQKGVIYMWSRDSFMQLAYNFLGLSAIIVWSAGTSFILFGILKWSGYLRISEEVEKRGLDVTKHGDVAYPRISWNWESQQSCPQRNHTISKGKSEYDNNAFEMEMERTNSRCEISRSIVLS